MKSKELLERNDLRNRLSARKGYESIKSIKSDEHGGHMHAGYKEEGEVSGPTVEEVRVLAETCKGWLGVVK